MEKKLNINPWFSIWIRPRKTIRAIVEYDPNFRLWILSTIYGLVFFLGLAKNLSLGFKMGLFPLLLFSFILSPFGGYLLFSFAGWIVAKTGKWIGGKGSFLKVRSSIAWSNVPMIVNVFVWFVMIAVFAEGLFKRFPGERIFTINVMIFTFSALLVQLATSVWSVVIFINALAQVQMFSIGRAILNIIISSLILAGIILILVAAFVWTCGPFFDVPLIAS